MRHDDNVIGPNVAKFRFQRGWTQDELAAKLQLLGCYMTRDILANIESQRCGVKDKQICLLYTSQLAHTKGSAFLSVRALFPKASANLNIRWNEHIYVFELTESDHPVLSLNLEAPPTPEEAGVGHAPQVSPLTLLALLDKAKVFPLLKVQQPESVANVDFTTYDGKPLVSNFRCV